MAECEITGYLFAARITYQIQQDLLVNRSAVRVTGVELRALWSGPIGNCWVTGTITIDGAAAAELLLTNTGSCGIYNMGERYAGGGEGTWGGYRCRDVIVPHQPDGSAAIRLRVDLDVMLTNGTPLDPGINSTVELQLPRIPRVSEAVIAPGELGKPTQLQLARAAERFRDTVIWQCGSRSGTIALKTADTRLIWVPPLELAAEAPDRTAAEVTFTITSYDGDAAVGSRELTALCPIPASVVPTAQVTVADAKNYVNRYGGYIRTQSQAHVRTQAQGAYGSQIVQIEVTCGGLTGSGEEVVFALENSGAVPIAVTVTDSRGRKSTVRTQITVLPYEKPRAIIRQAYRCDEEGSSQPDGNCLKLVFDAVVTQVENGSASYQAVRSVHGGGSRSETALGQYDGQFRVSSGSVVLPAGADNGYDCAIAVTDSFQTVLSDMVLVPVAFVLLDFSRNTRAVGIGMRARSAGMLCIGLDADMEEHRLTNLAQPEGQTDAATRGYVDARIRALLERLGLQEDTV